MARFQIFRDGQPTEEIVDGDPHEHVARLINSTGKEHVAVYLEPWANVETVSTMKIIPPAPKPEAPKTFLGKIGRLFKAKDPG